MPLPKHLQPVVKTGPHIKLGKLGMVKLADLKSAVKLTGGKLRVKLKKAGSTDLEYDGKDGEFILKQLAKHGINQEP